MDGRTLQRQESRGECEASSEAALQERGVVVAQQFFQIAAMETLWRVADLAYSAADHDDEKMPQRTRQHAQQWGGAHVVDVTRFLKRRAPALAASFSEQIETIESRLAELFGDRWKFVKRQSYFRRQKTASTYIRWHTDAEAAGTARYDPCVNVWFPFVEVGINAPALEFLPGSHKRMPTFPRRDKADLCQTDDWMEENMADLEPWCPHLRPSDAVIFNHWTLHRTQKIESQTKIRISGEFRFRRKRRWFYFPRVST